MKPFADDMIEYRKFVAPHAGAWIETSRSGACYGGAVRRPPRGGVD